MKTKFITNFSFSLVLLSFATQSHSAINAPEGYFQPVSIGAMTSKTCDSPPPPFTGDLIFPSKYEGSDKARSTLNHESTKRYTELTADINKLETTVIRMADDYLSGRSDITQRNCLLSWLRTWAEQDALLSTNTNQTGVAVRKWTLAALSSAYLKVKAASDTPDTEPVQTIEKWLAALAEQVIRDYNDKSFEKMNNHDYWAGWSVMVTSAALNRQDLFDWANSRLQLGLAQVDEDGFLPNELKRKTRALSYHNFSLQPLVMLAVFSEANDAPLTIQQRAALNRLMSQVVVGIKNPSVFQQKATSEQDLKGLDTNYTLAWMEPYASYFGQEALFTPYFETLRPMKSTRLGGNLTRIFKDDRQASAMPPKITEIK